MWGNVSPQFDDRILEKMLPYTVNCHLHDNDGMTDQHLKPGRGNVNWKSIVKQLKHAPRLQVIQSEVSMIRSHDSIHEICRAFQNIGEL